MLLLTVAAAPSPAGENASRSRPAFEASTEVVASKLGPEGLDIGRRTVVIERDEIEELPVENLQDLLAALPGIGLTRRGARGVQGDLNLRGSTFEQSIVLVNGVRVDNPQTGHHTLDLFIPLEAIERIEVLYGPGAAVYGPDAFGGAINIVTGVADPAVARVTLGEHDLTGGLLAGSTGKVWGAAEREVHTGFQDNTEADVNQFSGGWAGEYDSTRIRITASAGRRRFGAHAFYSTRFPDERERTEGRLLIAEFEHTVRPGTTLTAALRLDRHEDDFILDRHRPDWYRNHHVTRGALFDLALRGSSKGWSWSTGFELSRDDIDSTNLGRRRQDRRALFAEIGRTEGPATFALQTRIDDHGAWGTVTTGAVAGRRRFDDRWSLRGAWGMSFRAPTYTELFYDSPATIGNPDLDPERGRSVEIGLDGPAFDVTIFRRRAADLIDFRLGDDGLWRATNSGRLTTTGVEIGIALPARGSLGRQRLGLTWLSSDVDVDPSRSRYALAHPRIEAAWTGALLPVDGWRTGWTLRFRDPVGAGSWATLDLRLGRRILREMWIDLEADNVLDREITEVPGVPLPGRWISLLVTWRHAPR